MIKELFYNANRNQFFIVSSKKVFRFENGKSTIISENNELTASTFLPKINALLLASEQGLISNTGETNNLIPLREIDFNSEKITALSLAGKRLFMGTSLGQIYVYNVNLLTRDRVSLSFIDKIILHRSEITKLFFDQTNNNLYSASFDNQVLKYNIDLEAIGNITSSAISFIGHEKWVWDINLIKNANGEDLIITADENGNLLSWFDTSEKLVAKVESLIKLKKQEK
jgi:WD40 repeat protein